MNPDNSYAIIQYTKTLGPADVKLIAVDEIPVEPHLAELCGGNRCEGFGQSMSCPPNAIKPSEFLKRLSDFSSAVVFKFDVPTVVLLGDDRFEVARVVHETAASVEQFAANNGYLKSSGYAAGSCKRIFCGDHLYCGVLNGEGRCRFPEFARPSMSGMGINFFELSKRIGWRIERITRESQPDETPMGTMAGMVLIG